MTMLLHAFMLLGATCALSEEACDSSKLGDSCIATRVDDDLDSEVPSLSLLQSQLEKTRVKVHALKDDVQDKFANVKHGIDVRASGARKNIEAKQVHNRTLLTKRSDHCETAKIYPKSGTTGLGHYAFASQCAAGCAEKAFTGYTFWPECGKEGGCFCRCVTASATLEDTDDPVISGDVDCDTCSYACSKCSTCSKVDRMDTTYMGLAGGTITWDLGIQELGVYDGFCFTPQQNDKAIEVAFVNEDGGVVSTKSLSDFSYKAGSQICYVTKPFDSNSYGGRPGAPKVRLYIDGVKEVDDHGDIEDTSDLKDMSVLLRFVDEGAAASDVEKHRLTSLTGDVGVFDDSTKVA